MTKILLDTNAYSKFSQGYTDVKDQIERSSMILLSTIVIGEVLAGFKLGKREGKNRELLNKFIQKKTVLVGDIGFETADIYAVLAADLRNKGKPIPTNDIWIAAQTIETGAKLITFDKHFLEIPGLRIWDKIGR